MVLLNKPGFTRRIPRTCSRSLAVIALVCFGRLVMGQPFTVQGPSVNSNDFRVTVFAAGLDFPLGMLKLPDESLLVVVNQGASFSTSTGKLVRLTDTNQDGVADGAGTVLYSGLPASQTAVRAAGRLILVTGDAKPITVLRTGVLPSDPLTLVGRIGIAYLNNRSHPNSALAVRKTPGFTNRYDLLFHLGAEYNFARTTNTLALTNSNIPGATGVLAGDSIHMITLIDDGVNVTATNLAQIASGLRNPAGYAFQPVTGDLYFQDNGIDGLVNANEPHSADELNFIARTNLGGPVEFFGFPTNYSAYRSNVVVGGEGVQPLITFRPIPNPANGRENEGASDIVFAPPRFPNGLNTGIFLGFHGRFTSAGTANEENPLAYADLDTGSYFHFILGQQPGVGHFDGLLATHDSLFVADLVSTGNPFNGAGAGIIYQIKSLVMPTPPQLTVWTARGQVQLAWDRGALQEAEQPSGPWSDVMDAFTPHAVSPADPRKFFRIRY